MKSEDYCTEVTESNFVFFVFLFVWSKSSKKKCQLTFGATLSLQAEKMFPFLPERETSDTCKQCRRGMFPSGGPLRCPGFVSGDCVSSGRRDTEPAAAPAMQAVIVMARHKQRSCSILTLW